MRNIILLVLVCTSAIGLFAQGKQYPEVDIPSKKYVLENGLPCWRKFVTRVDINYTVTRRELAPAWVSKINFVDYA